MCAPAVCTGTERIVHVCTVGHALIEKVRLGPLGAPVNGPISTVRRHYELSSFYDNQTTHYQFIVAKWPNRLAMKIHRAPNAEQGLQICLLGLSILMDTLYTHCVLHRMYPVDSKASRMWLVSVRLGPLGGVRLPVTSSMAKSNMLIWRSFFKLIERLKVDS